MPSRLFKDLPLSNMNTLIDGSVSIYDVRNLRDRSASSY